MPSRNAANIGALALPRSLESQPTRTTLVFCAEAKRDNITAPALSAMISARRLFIFSFTVCTQLLDSAGRGDKSVRSWTKAIRGRLAYAKRNDTSLRAH